MSVKFDNNGIAANILQSVKTLHSNNVTSSLIGYAKRAGITQLTTGALAVTTGEFTGRSAGDKFIVKDDETLNKVWWDNTNAMSTEQFDILLGDALEHLGNKKEIFNQQLFAGADVSSRYNVDVFSPNAWHSLFIRNLLICPKEAELVDFKANVSIVHAPDFHADPNKHGSKSKTCIALDFSRNIVVICGTQYAGEMKKSVFSLFNYHAPDSNIFPMHCSANVGNKNDTTLFFGLSGTGKTTLSAASDRKLVGDDEHGWSETGVFNLEGGCYAKAINLSAESEPEIYAAAKHDGAILENVVIDEKTGEPDYEDNSLTENTRIAYPLEAIPNRVESGTAPTPKNVVLLTADAFGVLPPIAKLSKEQAVYYFLSGYTAKVAGTERGITEPQATFSTCFGAPFMARNPTDYGSMFAKRLEDSGANCWLLNTGWSGGAYGVGKRMSLKSTRAMLNAALNGDLDNVEFRLDKTFNLDVPLSIEGVDDIVLTPQQTWVDKEAYEITANKLAQLFEDNFKKLGLENSEYALG
jgi:phosphoenolpyruvate carboxykinase (ATP)